MARPLIAEDVAARVAAAGAAGTLCFVRQRGGGAIGFADGCAGAILVAWDSAALLRDQRIGPYVADTAERYGTVLAATRTDLLDWIAQGDDDGRG